MSAVIEALYAAAVDQRLWLKALESVAEFTGSHAATLWVMDSTGGPRLPSLLSFNFDSDFMQQYLEHMVPADPTVQYLVAHPGKPIVHDGEYLTERDIDRSVYYDWHLRHTDARYRLLAQVCPLPGVQAGIALHRTRQDGRYDQADIRRLAQLYRHVAQALRAGLHLGTAEVKEDILARLLDRNPGGVLLFDDRRQLLYANQQAEEILRRGDGVHLTKNGLRLSSLPEDHRLQASIDLLLQSRPSEKRAGITLNIMRPSGMRPYVLQVLPVAKEQAMLSNWRPAICVLLADPHAEAHVSEQQLRSAFNLTRAEARLTALLVTGDDLNSAADKLGVKYSTARARLAEIFQKTQTHRQSELIRLVLSVLAVIK